jgi:hypothetical protein
VTRNYSIATPVALRPASPTRSLPRSGLHQRLDRTLPRRVNEPQAEVWMKSFLNDWQGLVVTMAVALAMSGFILLLVWLPG